MTTTPGNVREFSIRLIKNSKKRYHVMKFNGNLQVDIGKWTQVKMERENNMREYKINEEQPKFGAGSEFGREAKEEARRKKLGITARKYKADDQPWLLNCRDSTAVKKFKGIREGGVSENTAYYVFTHAEDGAIEAFPLQEWYKFQPIRRYKSLSAEEAEQEFSKKNKYFNLNSLMLKKRLKGEDDTELNEEEKGKKTTHKSKELKISEMDEWINSSDEDSSDEETKKEEEIDDRKKSKKNEPKKKKRDTNVEAIEESDDGDEEGRELDYISDSSDSESENTNLESVAEEKALRKLLNSDDEESEDSDEEMSNEDKEKEGETARDEKVEDKKKEPVKKAKKGPKKDGKKEKEERNSDFSLDSNTDDEPRMKPKKQEKEISSGNSSRSVIPTDSKRKIVDDALAGPTAKKVKLDLNPIPGLSQSGITEDAVRKYLMRKPMTTTALVQKFKSKKTGLSSEQLVNVMTPILMKINPVQQILNGKMYLSIEF
ncbi:hypothetical protein WA026_012478 [Henosepilachna vigintioctopunctata]|uniref:Transcription initiation factor IIF subunit alpha n=1 Tax=Henosepilachna vigintioctopunctata TaxID=420089 RepID=A0AAW1USF0_9CUCU